MESIRVLVLIPDSTRKRKGDARAGEGPSVLAGMRKVDATELVGLRKTIANAARLPPGPDLDPATKGDVGLMPAYRRYDGNMYRRIPRDAWERRTDGVEIGIVSALYGLALSREPIRAYGFSMAESLPGVGAPHGWWRENGLPRLLASFIAKAQPERVIDLLSLEYRKAVDTYRSDVDVPVEAIDFPGLGRGSQPLRGELVAEILRGKR